MAISDEERRHIAAGLRRMAANNGGTLGMRRMVEVGDAAKQLMGVNGLPDCASVMRRYADLIDRPTTRIEADEHGRARCASCGCDDWCLADGSHFCPDCGAEVVRDGD